MPTLYRWQFIDSSNELCDQGAYPGDSVNTPLGVGELDRVDASDVFVQFQRADHREVKTFRKEQVSVLQQRTARSNEPRAAAGGRRGAGNMGIASLMGAASDAAIHTSTAQRAPRGGIFGRRGCGAGGRGSTGHGSGGRGGRGSGFGRGQPAATAARGDDGPSRSDVAHALFQIGAEYGSSDDESAATSQAPSTVALNRKRSISVKEMDAAQLKHYKQSRYELTKNTKQDGYFDAYAWLSTDAVHGAHCKHCIVAKVKSSDKLATTGYGFEGEGAERKPVPIPSEQKLKAHEAKQSHKDNVMKAEQQKGVNQNSNSGGLQTFMTITPEDELYARTIRTVHLISKRQLSLNDMQHLLELQSANGLVVSYDHCSCGSSVEDGGLSTWLQAGANYFHAQQRDRAQSSLMRALFPSGVPIGLMGDGSNDRSLSEQEAVVHRYAPPLATCARVVVAW